MLRNGLWLTWARHVRDGAHAHRGHCALLPGFLLLLLLLLLGLVVDGGDGGGFGFVFMLVTVHVCFKGLTTGHGDLANVAPILVAFAGNGFGQETGTAADGASRLTLSVQSAQVLLATQVGYVLREEITVDLVI